MPANIFLYIGLLFAIFELIKLFPFNKIQLPKLIQLTILVIGNLLIIIFLPELNVYIVFAVVIVTLIFTLLPFLLSIRLNRNITKNDYFMKSKLPEILYLLNWDNYSKGIVKLKSFFSDLMKGNLEDALQNLIKYNNNNKSLAQYNNWHQFILNLLLLTRNFHVAYTYLDSVKIDLSLKNIPAGLLYLMIRIYTEFGDFKKASLCLNYIDTHYHDVQHRTINLTMYLLFYALSGCEENFNMIIKKFPQIKNQINLTYWRAILLLKTKHIDTAILMLKSYLQKIPKNNATLINYIQNIIKHPENYSVKVYNDSLEDEISQIIKKTVPREDDFKHNKVFINNLANTKIKGIHILCGLIALITIIEFISFLPKTVTDFFVIQSPIINYIKIGGFSPEFVNQGQWIRFITSIFLHADWMHLLVNLYGLYILGKLLEKSFGTYQLFFTFLLSGIAGNLLSFIFSQGVVGVGASGGVFGVLGAFIIYILWRRKDFNKAIFQRLMVNFVIIIGVNIYFGLSNPQINNLAHLGGFMAGVSLAFIYTLIFENLRKLTLLYNKISFIISIGIFIITLIMWYPLYEYNYFENIELSQEIEYNNYILKIPKSWEIKEQTPNSMIIDYYTSFQIHISNDPKYYDTNLKEKLIKEQKFITNELLREEKNLKIRNEVTELDNGWYFFAFERWNKNLNKYYYHFFYAKAFPNSICYVVSFEFTEYSNDFKTVFYKFLNSIRESQ